MYFELDPRVRKVVAFMEEEFLADELRGIAEGTAKIAPFLWENFNAEAVYPLKRRAGDVAELR